MNHERLEELPEEYRTAAQNFAAGVDQLTLARMNMSEDVDSKAVPPEAVHIESRGEAPEGAEVIEGDRGGLYYLPPGEDAGSEEGVDLNALLEDEQNLVAGALHNEGRTALEDGREDDAAALRELAEALSEGQTLSGDRASLLVETLRESADGPDDRVAELADDLAAEAGLDEDDGGETYGGMDQENVNSAAVQFMRADYEDDAQAEFEEFFDSLSDEELTEAYVTGLLHSSGGEGFGPMATASPEQWTDATAEELVVDRDPPHHRRQAPMLSRMDSETLQGAVDEAVAAAEEEYPTEDQLEYFKTDVYSAAGRWAKDPDARLEMVERAREELDLSDRQARRFDRIENLTDPDSWEDLEGAYSREWAASGGSYGAYVARLGLEDFGPNGDGETYRHKGGLPVADIELTEDTREALESVYEQTQEELREEHGETVRLQRGVQSAVSVHSPLESWTQDPSTAENFDGHAVLEAEVPTEAVFSTYETLPSWREDRVRGKEEYMVLGGVLNDD